MNAFTSKDAWTAIVTFDWQDIAAIAGNVAAERIKKIADAVVALLEKEWLGALSLDIDLHERIRSAWMKRIQEKPFGYMLLAESEAVAIVTIIEWVLWENPNVPSPIALSFSETPIFLALKAIHESLTTKRSYIRYQGDLSGDDTEMIWNEYIVLDIFSKDMIIGALWEFIDAIDPKDIFWQFALIAGKCKEFLEQSEDRWDFKSDLDIRQ